MAGNLYNADLRREGSNQIWFRYIQREDGVPSIKIYTTALPPALVKEISGLGSRPEGTYACRSRAIFWDRKDTGGSTVAAGTYFVDLYIDGAYNDRIKIVLT